MGFSARCGAIATSCALALTLPVTRGFLVACMPRHLVSTLPGCLGAPLLVGLAGGLIAGLVAASGMAGARVVAGLVAMARSIVSAAAAMTGIGIATCMPTFPTPTPTITLPGLLANRTATVLACVLGRMLTVLLAFPLTLASLPLALPPSTSLPLLVSAIPAVM